MPTLATTSRVQVRRIKESTFGTTPGTGNGLNLRVTGESFAFDVRKEVSKELRSDRQTTSAVPIGAGASGGFNFELSYGEFDPEFESVMQGAYTVYGTNGVGATFSGDFTATTLTAAVAPTGSSAFTGLVRGQWFRLTAPSNPNDGLFFKLSSSVSPTSTVLTVDASTPFTGTATGVAGCAVATSRLANGTTQSSFTYEKELADVAQFFAFRGMTPSKLTLNWAAGALTTGSFDFMGKDAVRAGVTALPGTAVASRAYDIHNGATGVNQLWEGTAPLTSTFVKSMTLTIDNSLRGQEAIANYGNVGIGSGSLALGGTMEAYFADGSLYDKFLNNTYTSIVLGTQDAENGNGYIITLPKVNLMSSKILAGAKDQDIMASFEFSGLSDDANSVAALRKMIFIDRVGAALAPL